MKQTCETCDWYCYGTWPENTCDKWERTLLEVDVPEDVFKQLTGMPTKKDIRELREEVEALEKATRRAE